MTIRQENENARRSRMKSRHAGMKMKLDYKDHMAGK
jgi:hypothetical protein